MTDKKNSLSKTEWSLMQICWKKGKTTAREIYEESLSEKERSYQAVTTMLERMVNKGHLSREKLGPIWLYKPVKARKSVIKNAIENFVSTVLDNSVAPLFAHLADKKDLSQEEINSLKKLIEEKDKGDKE